MTLFIVTFIIMLIAVLAMAIGVLSGRPSIKGSCGGLNNIEGLKGSCSCSEPCEERKKAMEKQTNE
jgi:hypothetical protein